MKRILLTGLLIGFGLTSRAASQPREYLLKTVFLERFTRFIEWPQESAMSDTSKPFILGCIGDTPIRSTLHTVYRSQTIKNKQPEIRHVSSL